MKSSPRRIRGRLAVLIALPVVVVAVAAGYLALVRRPAPADIIELVAVDAEYAVIVRDIRGEAKRSFVSLFDRHGEERWGALIPRFSASRGARTAVAANAGVVTVRTIANQEPTIYAFDALRGKKLGQIAPLGLRRDASGGGFELPTVGNVYGGGDSFELYGEPDLWATVVATDFENGMFRWKTELGGGAVGPVWLRDQALLVHQPGTMHMLSRQTGADTPVAVPVATNDSPCVVDDTLYVLDQDGVMRVVSVADGRERSVAVDALRGKRLTGRCGRFGSRLVLVTTGGDGAGTLLALDQAGAQASAVDDTGMREAWSVPIGRLAADELLRHVPDHATLAGALPRMVPLVVQSSAASGPEETTGTLIMLDLEAGRVAWQSRPLPWLGSARLMTVDGRHYLANPAAHVLAVIDGATGSISAAVRLDKGDGHYQLPWPKQLVDGHLWLFAGERRRVLDAATLAPLPDQPDPAPLADSRAALIQELNPMARE